MEEKQRRTRRGREGGIRRSKRKHSKRMQGTGNGGG